MGHGIGNGQDEDAAVGRQQVAAEDHGQSARYGRSRHDAGDGFEKRRRQGQPQGRVKPADPGGDFKGKADCAGVVRAQPDAARTFPRLMRSSTALAASPTPDCQGRASGSRSPLDLAPEKVEDVTRDAAGEVGGFV